MALLALAEPWSGLFFVVSLFWNLERALRCKAKGRDSDSNARLIYISAMLRMRKKPPEGLPTLNVGKPWSEDDLADLKEMVRQCRSPRQIAEYLQREMLEVEAKIAERFG